MLHHHQAKSHHTTFYTHCCCVCVCVCVYVYDYVIGSIAGPKQRPTSKPDATLPTAAAVSCRTAAIQIHPIMHLLFVFYIWMIYSLDMIWYNILIDYSIQLLIYIAYLKHDPLIISNASQNLPFILFGLNVSTMASLILVTEILLQYLKHLLSKH